MEDIIENSLTGLLDAMGASYTKISRAEIAGQHIFMIETDDARPLIGMHGDTIHAIDAIVKKIVEKQLSREPGADGQEPHFLIDVNDYRSKQIRDIQQKALMMADRARSFQYDVELTPMSAYERLIVHTTLQGAPQVKTESLGEGRNRRVVIKYAAE